jgi:CRP/FNR family transcriptional regulator, cyclic AMP receptor protein
MAVVDSQQALKLLSRSPLFRDVDPAVFHEMLCSLSPEHWPRHRVVMDPQQAVDRFFVLLSGRVKVTRQNASTGREVTLFLLGPGDGFNVISLLDGERHDVAVQTLDAVQALSAPVALWRGWLDTYPAFRHAMRRYVDAQMRELVELAGDLAVHDTMTRLAHLILRYYDTAAPPGSGHINLIEDLPHEELAHMIGTVRVVVNRLLAELRREGVVDACNGRLRVLDLEKLLQKAERDVQQSNRKGGAGTHGLAS